MNERENDIARAREGQHHVIYPRLDFDKWEYLCNYSVEDARLIIKARSESFNLNFRPFDPEADQNCTLCNLNDIETVIHFIGVCPILAPYRLHYLNKTVLSIEEVCSFLNGTENWSDLCKYLKSAISYRRLIINEFYL